MKRVWLVNQYAVPPSLTGGLRPYSLMRSLKERGYDPLIVAGSFNHWTREEVRLREGESERLIEEDGVPFAWMNVPPYPGSTLRRFFSMKSFAKSVVRSPLLRGLSKPDVVIGSNPHLFGAEAGLKLANRADCPFVMEIRDLWPQSLVDYGRFGDKHPVIQYLRQIEGKLYRGSSSIVTLLPGSEKYLVGRGAPEGGIYWLPNGVDISTLPAVQPLPNRDEFVVAFVGIHGIANGLGTALDAAEILKKGGHGAKIRFRFVGDGGEKDRLKADALARGLTNCEFCDPVPKSEVAGILANADAGLMILKPAPVFKWGISPNKLFDYFGAGRPVIFSVNSSNNPVADAKAGVSVEPDNAESLAAGILELAKTPLVEREAMGQRGRKYVEENHDLNKLGDVLDLAIREAMTRKRGGK